MPDSSKRASLPFLPIRSSFPKRTTFGAGGLAAGFGMALTIMYLIALLDKSMHTERDVQACLNLAVLTTIPMLKVSTTEGSTGLLGGNSLRAIGAD